MIFINLVVVCASAFLIQKAVGDPPKFRILAPPFICPKDKDAVIDKPDNTVVTLQTDGQEVKFHWTVRWHLLVAPTQRFTLELWRTVRELENKLNQPQIEPNVFIINNTELLSGVSYIFNVTATSLENDEETEVFHVDNIKGDPKLLIEGRSDMFSIVLIGGQVTYANLEYMLEAQVTTCYGTQDYYFVWSVASAQGKVNVSDVKGSRLVIAANTLRSGLSYDVLSQVFKYSNGEFITENRLPFRVLHRNLNVNFNVDVLVMSINKPFSLHTDINQIDYVDNGLTVAWMCTSGGEAVDTFYKCKNHDTLIFPDGLHEVGEYLVSVTVDVQGHRFVTGKAVARIIVVEPPLPIIEVSLMQRDLNENTVTTLKANVTDMAPGCSITWYFKSERCILAKNSTAIENCDDSEHGTPISASINFYSLEENFLSELTDYTNETGSKSVFADFDAATGRARMVAECGCTENNCSSEGAVYADIQFRVNNKPLAGDVLVMPETGIATETLFRISTLAIVDPNRPLRYSFYCELNHNDTLILGSYLEHLAVETFLPYIDGGTAVWVEVCDSLGACSSGTPTVVQIAPGEARTVDALLEDARAHVQRCELIMLRRLVASAVVTYTNAGQADALIKFTSTLREALDHIDEHCVERNYEQYSEFLRWLARSGLDTTDLE